MAIVAMPDIMIKEAELVERLDKSRAQLAELEAALERLSSEITKNQQTIGEAAKTLECLPNK